MEDNTEIINSLLSVISDEYLADWLEETNPAFDGDTPMQLIIKGDVDRLEKMVYHLQT